MNRGKQYNTVKLDKDKCKGCVTCMRRCPTEAIRVRDGKAKIKYELCIGCGECIRVCPHHAKTAVYDSLSTMNDFKYKIALPSPSLYGQFNNLDDINYVLTGLKHMGFDAVAEVSGGAELVSEATRKALDDGSFKRPIISSACPAIVELILIRFHNLKDNLLKVLAPVDVAAKLAIEKALRETGLKREEIGLFFISPCPAKVFALKSSLSVKTPYVDRVLSQSDVYFELVEKMNKIEEPERLSKSGIVGVGWASTGGEASGMRHEKYLAADGVENCLGVLRELEDGKLSNIDFVELNACPGGCVGGVLNMENPFVAKAKIHTLRKYMPVSKSNLGDSHLEPNDIAWETEPEILDVLRISFDRMEALKKLQEIEQLLKTLPALDCGNCGAPSCRAFAEDVVLNGVSLAACTKKEENK